MFIFEFWLWIFFVFIFCLFFGIIIEFDKSMNGISHYYFLIILIQSYNFHINLSKIEGKNIRKTWARIPFILFPHSIIFKLNFDIGVFVVRVSFYCDNGCFWWCTKYRVLYFNSSGTSFMRAFEKRLKNHYLLRKESIAPKMASLNPGILMIAPQQFQDRNSQKQLNYSSLKSICMT